jgi:hypothetical protein
MEYKTITGLLALLVVGMGLAGGCTDVVVPPGITDTPTPRVENVTVPATPAVPARETTVKVQQSGTPVPAPAVSAACRDLVLAAAGDAAFLHAIKDNGVLSDIYNLGKYDCNLRSAARVNREIATSPQPETPLLIQARQDMVSAASHCYDPADSQAQAGTNEDLDRSLGNMDAYGRLVSSCEGKIDENISASLKISVNAQGGTLLHAGSDDVQSFTTAESGIRLFTISSSGNGKFTVWLKDSQGKKIDLLVDTTGPFDGKRSQALGPGTYFVDVTASGPWTISVTTP